jgi:hypothetical protein
VLACVRRGVNVIQLNLDEGLAMFGDNSRLTWCCRSTPCSTCATPRSCCAKPRAWAARHRRLPQLRALAQPPVVLRGRMPVTRRLPYQWYDTPNIRVGT